MIIGAQKAGTSSLHYYLDQHPKLAGSFPKELHYYSKYIHYPNRNLKWYRKHFTTLTKRSPLFYESSPNYLYHENAAKLIKEHHPDIKLIILLRNPIHRAFSGWNMYRDYFKKGIAQQRLADGNTPGKKNHLYEYLFKGRETFPGFRETIEIELNLINEKNPEGPNILRKGLYYDQITNYLKYFNRDQLLILSFDELIKQPIGTFNKVLEFLKVENKNNWKPKLKIKNKRSYEKPINQEDLDFLTQFYEEPNRKLTELLQGKVFW